MIFFIRFNVEYYLIIKNNAERVEGEERDGIINKKTSVVARSIKLSLEGTIKQLLTSRTVLASMITFPSLFNNNNLII